jgi:hypothetical protein
VAWPTLGRMFCYAGTCALPHRWQAADAHGLTSEQADY